MAHIPRPPPPKDCGRRLLTHVVDERAAAGHERPFALIPNSANVEKDGFREVSYREYASAIDACAHWIAETIGISTSFETLAYAGPTDLRYQVLAMAVVKTGHVMFFPSPRNSAEAMESLFADSKPTRLLLPSLDWAKNMPSLQDIRVERLAIPDFDTFVAAKATPWPFTKTWEEHRLAPWVQIHTSGSTGLPKLVTLRHANFTSLDAFQKFDESDMFIRVKSRAFAPFPPFHVGGLIYNYTSNLWLDYTIVLQPATAVLSADLVHAIHKAAKVNISMLIPSIIIDMSRNTEHLQGLATLTALSYAGGPLPENVGQILGEKVLLLTAIGATEWITVPHLPKEREDWPYLKISADKGGVEFQEQERGLYELVIRRREDLRESQSVFITYPDIDVYHTKDLLTPHPTKPLLWKYASRLDDFIALSNGEKLNPVMMEGLIMKCPAVSGSLVIGQGRFQVSLIVEAGDPSRRLSMDQVWPYIQEANKFADGHAKIAKDMVILLGDGQRFPRATKGTIQRAAANKAFAPLIDQLYENQAASAPAEVLCLDNLEKARSSLKRFMVHELDIRNLDASADFFSIGFDSLQLIRLLRAINGSVSPPIDAKYIYDHPTLDKLAEALCQGTEHYNYNYNSDDEDEKATWDHMDLTFRQFADEKSKGSGWKGWLHSRDGGPIYPPDGGHAAWLQLLGAFLLNVSNWGLVNTFGSFQDFYSRNMLANRPTTDIAWIGTLQGALLLIVGVLSGPLFDAGYFKILLASASVMLVVALMLLSLCHDYYQIMLAQGVLIGICCGLLYVPSVGMIPLYFKRHRGLALGLATAGGSLGGVIYPQILRALLVHVSFGWAVRTLGFIALATLGVANILIKPIGVQAPRQLVEFRAFTELHFACFSACAFFIFAALLVPFFLMPTFSIDKIHTSTEYAYGTVSILNASQFFGRIISGAYADYNHAVFGGESVLFVAQTLVGVLGFAWIGVTGRGGQVVWLIFYGAASGVCTTMPAVVLPWITPNMSLFGTRLGMLYACAGVGLLVSVPIATAIDGNFSGQSFTGAAAWTGASGIVAAGFFFVVLLKARQRRVLYEAGKPQRTWSQQLKNLNQRWRS